MEYSVIKEGDLFLLTDLNGDIALDDENGHGLYTKDTRFLSRMDVQIDGEKPALLSSSSDKSYVASIRLMKNEKDKGAIEIHRERFIYDGVLYERFILSNYFLDAVDFDFSVSFDSDFQDMFIVRKYRTGEVGQIVERFWSPESIAIRYRGADRIERSTQIKWKTDVNDVSVDEQENVHFKVHLDPKEERQICFLITPMIDGKGGTALTFEEGLKRLHQSYENWVSDTAQAESDSDLFNGLFARGVQDLRMLLTDVGYGDTPVAGLPWFAVPFGRDSLITSLFMLPLNPKLAQGTLRTLAAHQGTKTDPWRDEQPGKIMHELRFGELVNTKQSPFSPYYGTVDSTPLFLVLISEYVRWTGDFSLVEELQPNIERALAWIDQAEQAGKGFLTYHQEAEKGFPNQGWKDSANSIVHESGHYAASPIALSEVQGYVYHAKKGLAAVYRAMGQTDRAEPLETQAAQLKSRFEEAFWMEDEQFYAIALDKDQNKVHSVTSNPGHLLMGELPSSERAASVAKRLLRQDMFSGFGIRTMSTDDIGYYPMSYHNGSVWPHDNGMILLGLSRMGFKEEASRVISALLDASSAFEYQRLPELFCGHGADVGYLVQYPTTCSPQAWAAATSIVFLQAMLGIEPDALTKTIKLGPALPESMNELTARDIRIGEGVISINVTRTGKDSYKVEVPVNTTGFEIVVV